MKGFRLLLIVTFSLLLTKGCFMSRSFVRMEVLYPALISYPDSVHSVGFLNRAPLDFDTYAKQNNFSMDEVTLEIADTIVIKNLTKGIWDAIKSSELSYLDTLAYLVSRRADTSGKSDLVPSSLLNTIFRHYQLDALIVLEYYYITMFRSQPFYNYDIGDLTREYGLTAEMLWRVYLKDQTKPLDEYKFRDTLYYIDTYKPEKKFTMQSTDVLRQGMYEMGYRYGLRHTMVWYEVSRIIFRGGNSELGKAASFTDEGRWEEAAQIWFDLEEDESTRVAACACHNIAVYYELQDEVDKAYEYAKKAQEYWDNNIIEAYVQELDIRLKNNRDIMRQYRID